MKDPTFVQVTDTSNKLLHNLDHVSLGYLVVLQKLKKLPAMNLLHHNEHPAFSFIDFSHLDDVRMAQETNNLNFISEELFLSLVELRLVNLFQSVRDLCAFVFCFVNL